MKPPIGVSVVVLNWNGKHLLEECLPSVIEAAHSYPGSCEVIVVDNGSTDGSVSFLEENFPASVKLAKLPENAGFQIGCNKGIDASQYDSIVLLNNDVAVQKDFIGPLIAHLMDDNSTFAVGPKMFYWDRRNVFCSAISGHFSFGHFHQSWAVNGEHDLCGRLSPTLYLSGGAMAFNKQMFTALGQFDPLYYPIYWEDFDICYRAWKRGWRILYEPRSVVYHKVSATMQHHKLSFHFYMRRNNYLFVWRNVTDRDLMLQHLLYIPANIVRSSFAYAKLFGINWPRAMWLEVKSFIGALTMLSLVATRRAMDRKVQVLSDKEVLRLSNWREDSAMSTLTRRTLS
jgi:GT2 family glycosyltransferase